jgi:hypothetical protein
VLWQQQESAAAFLQHIIIVVAAFNFPETSLIFRRIGQPQPVEDDDPAAPAWSPQKSEFSWGQHCFLLKTGNILQTSNIVTPTETSKGSSCPWIC